MSSDSSTPTPSSTNASSMPASAGGLGDSLRAALPSSLTGSGNPPLGPVPAPSSTDTLPIKPSPGDNSAPPPVATTPVTQKQGLTIQQIIVGILFFIFTGYAIYYGWILGQQEARVYLLYVQSFGPWLRGFFVRPPPPRVV